MHRWLGIYLRGVCMGAADIVPGVSGGTIALIVGIYDRLVAAIAALNPRVLHHLRHPTDRTAWIALIDDLRAMDVPFLLVLGAGIGTAVIVVSQVILVVFEAYPAYVNAFFFGLIAASAIVVYQDVAIDTAFRGLVAVIGFLLAFVVSGLTEGGSGGSLPFVLVAGAIAISAMVLPGISGAAFLYVLGQYEYLLDALDRMLIGIVSVDFSPDVTESSVVVVTFLTGAVIGLLTTAHVVSWALARNRVATMLFLVSLMVGALRLPVEEVYAITGVPGGVEAIGLVAAALVGIVAVIGLDRATGSLDYV